MVELATETDLERLRQMALRFEAENVRLHRRLVERSRSASSSAAAAIRATPDRDSRQLTIVRSQQSMIAVRWHHPSCPQKTCVASIAQRTFGLATRDIQP